MATNVPSTGTRKAPEDLRLPTTVSLSAVERRELAEIADALTGDKNVTAGVRILLRLHRNKIKAIK